MKETSLNLLQELRKKVKIDELIVEWKLFFGKKAFGEERIAKFGKKVNSK